MIGMVAVMGAWSCSTSPATGGTVLTGFTTTADEVRIGREQNPQIIKAFGGAYNDPALAAYVNRIGQSLAVNSERKDLTYTFTVLDSPIVNAMAIPGGYVYVTRGLLALASNEAELAGVLGHEIGHITGRHHARGQSRQVLAGVGLTILGAVAGAPIAQGTQMLAAGFLQKYSRDQEYEADLLGIRYLARAGYDPSAMASFLAKLNQWTQLQGKILGQPSADRVDYLSSHPNTLDRVREATAAAQIPKIAKPIVGEDAYLKQIDGMLFGEPLSQGLIRGSEFIHPVLQIRFTVPRGFQLFDSPQAVYGLGPSNAMIVFDYVAAPSVPSMAAYVNQSARQLNLSDVRQLDINGLEAATGWGHIKTNRGAMDLRIVAIRSGSERVYRIRFLFPQGTMSSQFSTDERAMLQSFRTITQKEAAALKPLRVRVVTVKKGQDQRDLARRMTFDTYQLERFQTLNGLGPGDRLRPGQQVKIVMQ